MAYSSPSTTAKSPHARCRASAVTARPSPARSLSVAFIALLSPPKTRGQSAALGRRVQNRRTPGASALRVSSVSRRSRQLLGDENGLAVYPDGRRGLAELH